MRVVGYLGLLAAIVIVMILAVNTLRSAAGTGTQAETGSQKAARELRDDENAMDTGSELRSGIRDALGN